MRFGVAFCVLAGAGLLAVVVLGSLVFIRVPLPVYFVPTGGMADSTVASSGVVGVYRGRGDAARVDAHSTP